MTPKKKKPGQTADDVPAENKNTVTNAVDEDIEHSKDKSELNSANKAYYKTGRPQDISSGTDRNSTGEYESQGSEFGADPEATGKINRLKDENDNVTQQEKDEDVDSH